MRLFLFFLLMPFLLFSKDSLQVKKLQPGLYQITKTGLSILDNYAKMYFQCSAEFDSAFIQLSVLKENYRKLGDKQAEANNKINNLMESLSQAQVTVSNIKAENATLKLDNATLKQDIKKEKRNSFFTKLAAGVVSLAAIGFAVSR